MTVLLSAHPNTDLALRGFQAIQRGDLSVILELLHPDVTLVNDVGAGPWAGTFVGRDAFLTMLLEFVTFLEGTYEQELVALWADGERIVELVHETGERSGQRFDNRAVILLDVRDAQVVHVRTIDFDRAGMAAFWRAFS